MGGKKYEKKKLFEEEKDLRDNVMESMEYKDALIQQMKSEIAKLKDEINQLKNMLFVKEL